MPDVGPDMTAIVARHIHYLVQRNTEAVTCSPADIASRTRTRRPHFPQRAFLGHRRAAISLPIRNFPY